MLSARIFRPGTLGAVLSGFLPVAAVWLYFEISRFGHPLAGYAGEGFTHPFVDGAWRLLVGPNKGLLLYFPAAFVAVAAFIHASGTTARARSCWPRHPADRCAVAARGAVVGVARRRRVGTTLLVPGIPLLAAAAAIGMSGWRPLWRGALIALSILVNVPPLLQHPTTVVRYMWACAWPEADAQTAAGLPHFARRQVDGLP